jgi:acyl-CoA synthetase (AMP-forming)/AMP-acid ligase II
MVPGPGFSKMRQRVKLLYYVSNRLYYVDHGLAVCRTGDIGEMELDGTLRIIDRQELSIVYCTIFLSLDSQKVK